MHFQDSSEGDPNTAFGALDARYVPYIVLPETFATKTVQIKGNALSAVICNGKMFYGIFGDEKYALPEPSVPPNSRSILKILRL